MVPTGLQPRSRSRTNFEADPNARAASVVNLEIGLIFFRIRILRRTQTGLAEVLSSLHGGFVDARGVALCRLEAQDATGSGEIRLARLDSRLVQDGFGQCPSHATHRTLKSPNPQILNKKSPNDTTYSLHCSSIFWLTSFMVRIFWSTKKRNYNGDCRHNPYDPRIPKA